ncbi:MAG: DMT family transporter, partial [Pseudomonadota bacterium]
MSLTVFLVVIAAAILHATWNAAVKGSDDKVLGMTAVIVGQALPALALLVFLPLPSVESLPFFCAGLVFHLGYQIFLISAYQIGDFTQVYPIARGSGPLLVTLVSIFFLGVELSPTELAAVGLIVLGIVSLSLVRQGDGLRNPRAAMLAVCTGICIAGYSLADGLGARASESAVGFMASLMLVNGIVFSGYIRLRSPGTMGQVLRLAKWRMVGGGIASFT